MSDDMYKERLRVQWEEEERRNMEQPESHYANVQFNGRMNSGNSCSVKPAYKK